MCCLNYCALIKHVRPALRNRPLPTQQPCRKLSLRSHQTRPAAVEQARQWNPWLTLWLLLRSEIAMPNKFYSYWRVEGRTGVCTSCKKPMRNWKNLESECTWLELENSCFWKNCQWWRQQTECSGQQNTNIWWKAILPSRPSSEELANVLSDVSRLRSYLIRELRASHSTRSSLARHNYCLFLFSLLSLLSCTLLSRALKHTAWASESNLFH